MKLKEIVLETRAWGEKLPIARDYCPDLAGLCAIVSKELCERLQQNGYKAKIAYNGHHCFVILQGRIIDLTATQFGNYPKIYIKKLPDYISSDKLYGSTWYIEKLFDNPNDLPDYQETEGWPKYQIAR